jgi:glyoxylate/hydroxypyruvate reductase A
MGLHISLCYPGVDPTPWLAGLRALLPAATVTPWAPGDAPADYGVVWAPPQQFIDEQTQLKAVFNIGAGVDKLLQLRLRAGLTVVRLDDAGMAVQMAEYVCHALMRHYRAFDAYEQQARAGHWLQRAPRSRGDFPVGIMGLGVLGQRVAQAVQHFGFPVLGWSRAPRPVAGVRAFCGPEALDAFLAATRVLVCLLPLTPDTRNILCRATLSRLQPAAYLINVARGALLVEDDLLALVDSGHIAGATLDVFQTEPLPAGHAFWQHPCIHVTPHVSAQTLEIDSLAQIAGKIQALERGETVAGVVDLARGY